MIIFCLFMIQVKSRTKCFVCVCGNRCIRGGLLWAGIFLKEMTHLSDLILRLWEMSPSCPGHSTGTFSTHACHLFKWLQRELVPHGGHKNKRILVCCGECSLKLVVPGVKVGLLCNEIFLAQTHFGAGLLCSLK